MRFIVELVVERGVGERVVVHDVVVGSSSSSVILCRLVQNIVIIDYRLL
jgi:hypothetical protein